MIIKRSCSYLHIYPLSLGYKKITLEEPSAQSFPSTTTITTSVAAAMGWMWFAGARVGKKEGFRGTGLGHYTWNWWMHPLPAAATRVSVGNDEGGGFAFLLWQEDKGTQGRNKCREFTFRSKEERKSSFGYHYARNVCLYYWMQRLNELPIAMTSKLRVNHTLIMK